VAAYYSREREQFFIYEDKCAFITTADHYLIKHKLSKPACDHPNMVNNNKILLTEAITSQESSQLGLSQAAWAAAISSL